MLALGVPEADAVRVPVTELVRVVVDVGVELEVEVDEDDSLGDGDVDTVLVLVEVTLDVALKDPVAVMLEVGALLPVGDTETEGVID